MALLGWPNFFTKCGRGKSTSPFSSPPSTHLLLLFSCAAVMLHSCVEPPKHCCHAFQRWQRDTAPWNLVSLPHADVCRQTHTSCTFCGRVISPLLLHNDISRLHPHTNTCGDNLTTEPSYSSLRQTMEICNVFLVLIHRTLSTAVSVFCTSSLPHRTDLFV